MIDSGVSAIQWPLSSKTADNAYSALAVPPSSRQVDVVQGRTSTFETSIPLVPRGVISSPKQPLYESMDNSFAEKSAAPPLWIVSAPMEQSLPSQNPHTPISAHSNIALTVPTAPRCAATLPDDSEFPGAPLLSFPESEYKIYLDKLPTFAGLPSDGSFPPLDTWEDICAEMKYLCGRLGTVCIVPTF